MTVLHFTKVLNFGNGDVSFSERMRFATRADAFRWVDGVNERNRKGQLPFRVIKFKAVPTV